MKTILAVYKFGNLYDFKTKRRILIDDGSQVTLDINPLNLLDQDPNLSELKTLNSKEKLVQLTEFVSKHPNTKVWKLFESGKEFRFFISAGVKRKDKTEQIKTTFQIRLQEDLFVYNKKDKPEDARFFNCACIVEKCLNDFEFFEPIQAKSLNDACTKTYELYFAMFGKSTVNAFDRIFEIGSKIPIRSKAENIQLNVPCKLPHLR